MYSPRNGWCGLQILYPDGRVVEFKGDGVSDNGGITIFSEEADIFQEARTRFFEIKVGFR